MDLLKSFLSKELNISAEDIYNRYCEYNEQLIEWNKKVNLISRKMNSIESNVLTSIFFLKKFDIKKYLNIIDIGTGGGFPGVPLAIMFPEIKFILIDSVKKKINALSDIVNKAGIKNAECICGRAEEVSKMKNHFHKYDIVISKSVSTLFNLFDWGKYFISKNGLMLCIKGGDLKEEFAELRKIKNIQIEVLNFDFETHYHIEDKKLVIIKPLNLDLRK
jgi:16S rRNA (guanine527-N7)-methyltransferase